MDQEFSTVDDLPRWFRTRKHSLQWIRQIENLDQFLSKRFAFIENPTGEEADPKFGGTNDRDAIREGMLDYFHNGGIPDVLIRDQEEGVFLEPRPTMELRKVETGS